MLTDEDDTDCTCVLQPASLGSKHAVAPQRQGDVPPELLAINDLPTCRVGRGLQDAALQLWRKRWPCYCGFSGSGRTQQEEAHPVLALAEVQSKLGRPGCEDGPAQKRG